MKDEIFEVFNPENQRVGEAPRQIVHASGLYHRSVHVFIFNSAGKVLIQQRVPSKDICPGAWDVSVAEHAKPGECGYQTALRGVREELGVEVTVSLLADFRLNQFEYPERGVKDFEFVQTYQAVHDGPFTLDPVEVAGARFITMQELLKSAHEAPGGFTPWLHRDLSLFP